jgi:hypothetical protein
LREVLRRHHAQREPGVDELVRQPLDGRAATLEDRAEADLARVVDAIVDGSERPAFVEVGRMDAVPGGAELVGRR